MNRLFAFGLTLAWGVALCVAATQTLHAQAKSPAFFIVEITVTNQDGYIKEFVPPITKSIQDFGGKYLAQGGKTLSFQGDPPKPRIVVIQFESLDKIQAWQDSPAAKAALQIGNRYSTQRGFAVEGLSP